MTKRAGIRKVIATVRVNRPVTVRLALLRRGRTLATTRVSLAPGRRSVVLRLPRRVAAGRGTARLTLRDSLANVLVARRTVRVPA